MDRNGTLQETLAIPWQDVGTKEQEEALALRVAVIEVNQEGWVRSRFNLLVLNSLRTLMI